MLHYVKTFNISRINKSRLIENCLLDLILRTLLLYYGRKTAGTPCILLRFVMKKILWFLYSLFRQRVWCSSIHTSPFIVTIFLCSLEKAFDATGDSIVNDTMKMKLKEALRKGNFKELNLSASNLLDTVPKQIFQCCVRVSD